MNLDVSLTDELGDFIQSQVASGRFASASEVVCEALRLLERYERDEALKLQWLSEAHREAIQGDGGGSLDVETIKAEALAKLSARSTK